MGSSKSMLKTPQVNPWSGSIIRTDDGQYLVDWAKASQSAVSQGWNPGQIIKRTSGTSDLSEVTGARVTESNDSGGGESGPMGGPTTWDRNPYDIGGQLGRQLDEAKAYADTVWQGEQDAARVKREGQAAVKRQQFGTELSQAQDASRAVSTTGVADQSAGTADVVLTTDSNQDDQSLSTTGSDARRRRSSQSGGSGLKI